MVAVTEPAVVLTIAWLLVLFVVAWRYRFGSLPSARAFVLVAAALAWLAFSLLQLADLLSPPYDDALGAVSGITLLVGAWFALRWWRTR
ncbi:hypothetical protein [Halobacterium sp. R2-5]|uniref:hypothetical protein n=1 Tax=Halobacterium sp. R2-5 TaxID=2715751 RepID=UPI00141D806C|nr:hypothetical protein [Halobacterium sp. R2-5]NIB99790.1 hypothetical protein [Halobacterium sp. R2-5]